MSGAHAAALAAGCCCRPAPDGPPDPAGCPQIGNTQPRTPADSAIDTVNVSFLLQSQTVLTNTDTTDYQSPCVTVQPQPFVEQALATGSGGAAAWNGVEWIGCGEGTGSVSPIEHGMTGRNCGDRCECLNYAPGCGSIPCCGDAHAIPRRFQSPGGFVAYSQSDIISSRQVGCPACCGNSGPELVGISAAEWRCGNAFVIRYGCLAPLPDLAQPCACPGLPPDSFGYYLLANVRIVSQRAIDEGAQLCVTPFLGNPSFPSFGRHIGVWSKPCCSANDSVRGTYRLAMLATSSGTTGFPAYSWLTTRSLTATVS